MSPAIRAASIGSVPEPHIGSTKPPPAAAMAGQSGDHQQGGGERLLHGRLDLDAGFAVAAPVQGLAGQVDRDRGALIPDDHVDAQVRVGGVDARPTAGLLREAIGDRVLHPHRRELRVAEPRVDAAGVDREGAVRSQMLLPRYRGDRVVQLVGRGGGNTLKRQEDPRGDARPQQRAVGAPQWPTEGDAAPERADPLAGQRPQLFGDERLSPARTCRPELEHRAHVPLREQDPGTRRDGTGRRTPGGVLSAATISRGTPRRRTCPNAGPSAR